MKRRRLKFALPFVPVLALAAITGIAHAVQQPDPTDSSFLSPTSSAGDGARLLADGLTSNGVEVEVQTTSAGVLSAAGSGPAATVFVTTPELISPYYLQRLAGLPARFRVVLVAPSTRELGAAGLDVTVDGPRWTASAPEPGCAADFATAAGPAAAQRRVYDPAAYDGPVRCYAGGLVEFPTAGADVTLIGAADPFRNDRADEHGNRALAVSLLARSPRVIWLDLHKREPAPTPSPTVEPTPEEDPWATEGPSPWDEGEEGGDNPPDTSAGDPQQGDPGDNESQGGSSGGGGNPLAQAFPPAVWATLALLVLAAIALAAASARRLGAPVVEPLPVRVRAAETVRGLGGLYRRAKARGSSLATLQAAARARLAEHYGLPPDSPVDEVAEHVAAQTGQPVTEVRHVLGGGVEDSDEELARAATTVQNLVRYATGQQNWQQAPDEGNVT